VGPRSAEGEPGLPEELPPPEVVERRLKELSDLYEFGKALREVRFVDEPSKPQPDRVRERPDGGERK
jgi:hypothetical protein